MIDVDAELTALIDGELDESAKSRLMARLAEDAALRERHEALRASRAQLDAAFATALDMAPTARLQALATALEAAPTVARRRTFAWRGVAAGFAAGLAVAAAAWLALGRSPPPEDDDWKSAVVEYMQLFTPETFAPVHADQQSEAADLQPLSAKLGVALAPRDVAVSGLAFKSAQLLAYDGTPLGEIAYADSRGAPVLFCIFANGGPEAPVRYEQRDGVRLASWSRGGRGYLIVAHASESAIAEMAVALARRF